MSYVSAPRRIACAVSGGAVILAALALIGTLTGIVLGTEWLIEHVPYVGMILAWLAITAVFLVVGAALVGMFVSESRKMKEMRERYGLPEIEPVRPDFMARRAKSAITAFLILWLEVTLLWLWARMFHDVTTGAALAQAMGGGAAIQVFGGILCALVWVKMDDRAEFTDRVFPSVGAMIIPLWMIHLITPFMKHIVHEVPGAMALSYFVGLVPVGILLGAAYSCEENIFDKMGMRVR